MPFKQLAATFIILLSLLISGCFGAKETDEVSYILAIGLDTAENGNVKATYQIAAPRSGGSGENSGENTTEGNLGILNTVVFPTPADSRMMLNAVMSRFPNVTHVRALIFSEDFARKGLGQLISHIVRNREFRETIFLIVVKGSAEEYMRKNMPQTESTIAKYYETMMLTSTEGTYYQRTTVHDFYTRLKNPGGSPYAVYSGINPMTNQGESAGPKPAQKMNDPHLPGGIPRSGTQNPIDFAGMAVFRGDKMIGVLNSDETLAVSILQGKFVRGMIGVQDPLQPAGNISFIIRMESAPGISVNFNDGSPVFDAKVRIEAEIISITSGINYEAPGYRELLEDELSNIIATQLLTMIAHTQELGTDPVGFGLYLRPTFANTTELANANLTELYKKSTVNVSVRTSIRRTGLAWRTSPISN